MLDKFKTIFKGFSKNSFSVFLLNISKMKLSKVSVNFARNGTYYGETYRHLSVRVGEHSGVSPLTWKTIDQTITEYVLTCDFKTAILKTELTDHFPIVLALKNDGLSQ